MIMIMIKIMMILTTIEQTNDRDRLLREKLWINCNILQNLRYFLKIIEQLLT